MNLAANIPILAMAASALSLSAVADPVSTRTEYRYPDRPNIVYSDAGMRAVGHDDPLAFTNEKSAISAEAAQDFLANRYGNATPQPRRVKASPSVAMTPTPLPPIASTVKPANRPLLAIQVGAFSSVQNAERVAETLRDYGVVNVKRAQVRGKELFRVFVAAGATKSEADATLARLKAHGFDGFVTEA